MGRFLWRYIFLSLRYLLKIVEPIAPPILPPFLLVPSSQGNPLKKTAFPFFYSISCTKISQIFSPKYFSSGTQNSGSSIMIHLSLIIDINWQKNQSLIFRNQKQKTDRLKVNTRRFQEMPIFSIYRAIIQIIIHKIQMNGGQEQQKEGDDNEWEGFEEFCQSTNSIHQSSQYNTSHQRSKTSQQISNNQQTIEKNVTTAQKCSPQKKRSRMRESNPLLKEKIPTNEIEGEEKQTVKENRQQIHKKQVTKGTQRFQRIPIMRRDQDYRNTCKMVYRNFAPRSSQTYFKTLKQCQLNNYTTTAKFKPGQNYIFNSKFQSGNLSAAFQGDRELI